MLNMQARIFTDRRTLGQGGSASSLNIYEPRERRYDELRCPIPGEGN